MTFQSEASCRQVSQLQLERSQLHFNLGVGLEDEVIRKIPILSRGENAIGCITTGVKNAGLNTQAA